MARGQWFRWGGAPRWAWAGIIVGTVVLAAGVPYALANPSEPPGFTAPPVETTSPAEPVRIVAIGDSYTGGSDVGGYGPAGWPALLSQRIPDSTVETAAAGGAGYVAVSPSTGQTLGEVAHAARVEGAAVVIVFGSRNDGPGIADQVQGAAAQTFADIRTRAPDATLIVIGPAWVSADVPAGVENNRDAISAAATQAGATFIDPLADGWFFDRPELIGADGVHPTDAGHAYLADRIEPVTRAVLGR